MSREKNGDAAEAVVLVVWVATLAAFGLAEVYFFILAV